MNPSEQKTNLIYWACAAFFILIVARGVYWWVKLFLRNYKMKKPLVMDTSWFRRNNTENLKKLSNNYNLLITDALVDEIFTTDDQKEKLISRLNDCKNFLFWATEVSVLIKCEIKKLKGFPFSEENRKFFINKCDSLNFPIQPPKELSAFLTEMKEDIEGPEMVKAMRDSLKDSKIKENVKTQDILNLVKTCLNNCVIKHSFPKELISKIDPNWVLYKKIEVMIVYQRDMERYNQPDQTNDKKLAHDSVDMGIVTYGSIFKGLATKDKIMKDIFKTVCPEGEIIG